MELNSPQKFIAMGGDSDDEWNEIEAKMVQKE